MEKIMYGYVYKTTFLDDGRIYIGQKKGIFTSSYKGRGKHFKLALNKYGDERFICELIQEAYSAEELDTLEKYYISEARKVLTRDEMFNIADGGLNGINGEFIIRKPSYPFKGRKHSKESIKKMSIARFRSMRESEAVKNTIGKTFKGKKHTEETRKHLSEIRKGKNLANFPREHFVNMTKKRGSPWNKGIESEKHHWFGRRHSQETKDKMSESRKNYYIEKRKAATEQLLLMKQ